MKKYRVYIERVERYSYQVMVTADTKDEAECKVKTMDDCDEFEYDWNELQHYVETTYEAEELKGDGK